MSSILPPASTKRKKKWHHELADFAGWNRAWHGMLDHDSIPVNLAPSSFFHQGTSKP
jgi:hypothetical protein